MVKDLFFSFLNLLSLDLLPTQMELFIRRRRAFFYDVDRSNRDFFLFIFNPSFCVIPNTNMLFTFEFITILNYSNLRFKKIIFLNTGIWSATKFALHKYELVML